MKKVVIFLFIMFIVIATNSNVQAKYVIEYNNKIADIKIDTVEPTIVMRNVTNSNTSYPKYANKTHTITLVIHVKEKNVKENKFNEKNVKILIGEKECIPQLYKIEESFNTGKIISYKVTLSGITEEGKLKVKVPKGTIIDISNNENQETIMDTGIEIDNTPPVVSFTQKNSENGKVIANIHANEKLRPIKAWNISTADYATLTKEFKNNVTYPIPIVDYAQNTTTTEVNINKATNIIFKYGALGGDTTKLRNWEIGQGNNEIVGQKMIKENPIYKTEMTMLQAQGDIEKDFIQMQNYMHTYWGAGSKAISDTYETTYIHGYNPGKDKYSSLTNGTLAYINQKLSLILGGDGINRVDNKGINNAKIPLKIAKKYMFGVSGISLKVKDNSYYTILYQVYNVETGWQKVCENGEEALYKHDKPISAFRASLIPDTEKQYLINYWNKDIGQKI